ncbi:MAG: prepilin peptidase [Patescibacteria group bacterium]
MNIIIFTIGLLFGSFLNSFIWRYRKNVLETIWSGRSICPACGHALSPNDLVPLFSFLVLGGKCRYCKSPISWQYPMVELFFGLLSFLIFWKFGLEFSFIFYLIIGFLLTALMVIDILDGILPNGLIVITIFVWLLYMIFTKANVYDWTNVVFAALIGFGFFLSIWLITLGKGMGVGDIKLALLLGLLAGIPNIYYIIFFAFILGALYVLPLLLLGKSKWKNPIAFGPFLILSYFLMLFMGNEIQLVFLRMF